LTKNKRKTNNEEANMKDNELQLIPAPDNNRRNQ